MPKYVKYLFFIEREFHIVLLLPLIQYIHDKGLGQLAIYNMSPEQSQFNISNFGLRKNVLDKYLDFQVEQIQNPLEYAPDITFMADFSYQYVEGLGKIVNIGHGTISKGWYYSKKSISVRENCADLLCVPGNIHLKQLKSQVKIPIEVTGMPKLDKVFSGTLKKEEILAKMNLNPNNKTVLLAPTFNDEFSLIPYLTEPIRKYIPEYLNLIIKLHGVTPGQIRNAFKQIAETNVNVCLCEDYDISESFAVSDILISDVSSVIYEFLAMHKPVILFDSPKQKQYPNFNAEDIEYQFRDVGYRFSHPNKIAELLFRSLTEKRDESINDIADNFISVRDGSSTERVIHAANALLETDLKRDLHLVLIDENEENTQHIIARFKDRFHISVISDKTYEGVSQYTQKPLIRSLKEIVEKIDENKLFVHHTRFDMSPQMPNFMNAHLMLHDKTGLAVPLVLNDEITYQQAKLRVVLNEEFSTKTMALQLTYSFAGQSLEIPYAEPLSFALAKSAITSTDFDENNNEYSWKLLLAKLAKEQLKISLAFDTMIYPYTPQVIKTKPVIQPNKVTSEISSFDYQENEELLKQRLSENPFDEKRILDLINYYYRNKMWDSVDVYTDMLSGDYQAVWYAIRSLEEQNHVEKAFDKLDKFSYQNISDKTWRAKWYALKGKLLIKLNRANEAKHFIDKAIEIDAHLAEALLARAAWYLINNNMAESEKDYQRILQDDPENRYALLGLGVLKQFSYDFITAEQYFKAVLKINDEDMEGLNGLVKCAWHTKNFESAENALTTYLEYHPAKLDILFTLSGIYYEQKKYAQALVQLDKIFLFDEDFPGAKELYQRIKDNF